MIYLCMFTISYIRYGRYLERRGVIDVGEKKMGKPEEKTASD